MTAEASGEEPSVEAATELLAPLRGPKAKHRLLSETLRGCLCLLATVHALHGSWLAKLGAAPPESCCACENACGPTPHPSAQPICASG